jgi:type II secretory pathway pseudopilin PulG
MEEEMRKGFSLIEVLVAIALVFFITCGTIRFLMASNKTGIDSNLGTYASVAAHTKLVSLKRVSLTDPDITIGWHEDKDNPFVQCNINYYRYWRVVLNKDGSRSINVYVTWNNIGSNGSFLSEADLKGFCTSKVEFKGTRDVYMP